MDPAILSYLNSQKEVAGTFTSSNTVNFAVGWAVPPSGAPGLTSENFTFFINGQHVPTSLVTLTEGSGNVTLTFNTSSLGYSLETDDEVTAIGKFSS